MNFRRVWVLVFLFTLTTINYADRVALSVAAHDVPATAEPHSGGRALSAIADLRRSVAELHEPHDQQCRDCQPGNTDHEPLERHAVKGRR